MEGSSNGSKYGRQDVNARRTTTVPTHIEAFEVQKQASNPIVSPGLLAWYGLVQKQAHQSFCAHIHTQCKSGCWPDLSFVLLASMHGTLEA